MLVSLVGSGRVWARPSPSLGESGRVWASLGVCGRVCGRRATVGETPTSSVKSGRLGWFGSVWSSGVCLVCLPSLAKSGLD